MLSVFLGVYFLVYSLGLKRAGFYFWEYKNFFNIRVRKFQVLKYKKVFLGWMLLFFGLGLKNLYFLIYKKLFRVSLSWNKKNFSRVSAFSNIRKYKEFLNTKARKIHFPKYNFFFMVSFPRKDIFSEQVF